MSQCLTCSFNNNPEAAPGGQIKVYKHWILEHINEPIPVAGWLILKTKRHAEGIIGLNQNECRELGDILTSLPQILKQVSGAEKIYMVCMTEMVEHLHIHIIPRYRHHRKRGADLIKLLEDVKRRPWMGADIRQAIPVTEKLKEILNPKK